MYLYETGTQLLCNTAHSPLSRDGDGVTAGMPQPAALSRAGGSLAGGGGTPVPGVRPCQCVSPASPAGPLPPLPGRAVARRQPGLQGLGALAAPSGPGGVTGRSQPGAGSPSQTDRTGVSLCSVFIYSHQFTALASAESEILHACQVVILVPQRGRQCGALSCCRTGTGANFHPSSRPAARLQLALLAERQHVFCCRVPKCK